MDDYLDDYNIIEKVPISSLFANSKNNLLYINKGNRLNKFGIHYGDYIIVDNEYKFENSCLYLILLYNEFLCIRKVIKDNDNYTLSNDDNCINLYINDFKIIGKVIGIFKSFK